MRYARPPGLPTGNKARRASAVAEKARYVVASPMTSLRRRSSLGWFATAFALVAQRIGEVVRQGQEVGEIGFALFPAPLDGVLRGLTHDGVHVTTGTKVIEVDPRGASADVRGISEGHARIAEGVLAALLAWEPHHRT